MSLSDISWTHSDYFVLFKLRKKVKVKMKVNMKVKRKRKAINKHVTLRYIMDTL